MLEASLDAGIYIPHLCHHPDLSPIGACRLCIVEIEGMESPVTSCTTPVSNGMAVRTKTDTVDSLRRMAMELMLAGHPPDCGTCNKYLNCELQSVKQYLGVEHISYKRRTRPFPYNANNPLFIHDFTRCILCGRCVRACHELRGVGVLFYKKKGEETYIGTADDLPLADSGCRFCGACVEVCPTGAIQDKEELVKGKSRKAAMVPCKYTCPAEIDVPNYIRFIREKNYSAAVAVVREKAPFPGVLGYVCDHPCEGVCRRGEINHPIAIRELKRFAAGNDNEKLWRNNRAVKPETGKKAAIIGAGPAGLTAAYYLAGQGHSVTVFEALPSAGGMMRYGIPEYRLPGEVLDREIEDIEDTGVVIKTGTRIESLDTLLAEGYDAVLITSGTHKGQKLSIPGADSEGVLVSIDYLRDVNLGIKPSVGEKVVVLGGGNVAFDCARVARRLGAAHVHIACLECREDMPAACDEIEQGEEEGISVHPSQTATRIINENGKITGVEFLDVESFSFDEDGNVEIETVDNSKHMLDADTVIFAIGQRPEIPEAFRIDITAAGLIDIDSYSLETSREGVFAAGDAVTGASSVIKAIASGRKTAIALDRYLEGTGNIDEKLAPAAGLEKCLGPGEGFAAMDRCEEPCILPEKRLQGFCEVVQDMDEETADRESGRCLQCDLRLKIKSVKFWGNY